MALLVLIFITGPVYSSDQLRDTVNTSRGPLVITPVQHASLMFEFDGKVIHVDPVLRMGDYDAMPKADLILITHEHGDHFDLSAIEKIRKANTRLVVNKKCMESTEDLQARVMQNGDRITELGIPIEAVPAYNILHQRENGQAYHPRGQGNGYILEMGGKRVYVAGDTENIPEMKRLENIAVAFLPMNLPYTMTPEMVADAARAFRPKILYPYHYGRTDVTRLTELLKDQPGIEVRIRDM
jgi:L-ascorbate metabolism protein UlaG (beta-lactamase superfamily)